MSVPFLLFTAIKTGRYTHEKRTRDIEEVKKLELQSKMKDDGTLAQSSEERNVDLEKVIKSITEIHMEQIPQLIMATVTKKEHEYLVSTNHFGIFNMSRSSERHLFS